MRSPRSLLAFLACASVASCVLAQSSQSGRVWAKESATVVAQPQAAGGSSSAGKLHIAPLALGFQLGASVSTSDKDCLFFDAYGNPYYSIGPITTSWVAYYGDPNAGVPKAGDVYYMYVFVSNPAACQSAGVQPWLILPANTSLAISNVNPVTCYRNGLQTTTGCSQNPPFGTSLSGASGYNLGFWGPLGGGNVEIHVPITSTVPGAKTLYARVDTSDGGSNPWATPSVSYFVASLPPTVSYPAPSSTLITDTTVRNTADVFNHYTAGTFYFDIGTTTSYGLSNAGNAVPDTGDSGEFYTNWGGLTPGTLYHWRARFVFGASTASGADQTFTTTASATVPPIPIGVDAVASSPTQVNVTWSTSTGATSYQIFRRSPGVLTYAMVATSPNTSYVDTNVSANSAYLYRVRAVNTVGASADSRSNLAITVIFTDDPLPHNTVLIKASHLAELRTAVNAVQALAGPGPGFTDSAIPGVTVKAVHINELRTQFNTAIGTLGFPVGSWADVISPGVVIQNYHVQQLRDRMK